LLRGNLMARAGVVILFFGVAFLLKYTYQHVHVPIELRLAGVALAAVALLLIGWRLRLSREGYALALQGGGVGLLYLTIFGALRLFGVLPAGPAFALLLAVAALSAMLAVLQNSLALAVLGASGGFLAPILASTGEGSHVALFGYYAVLNAGILAIAWFRAWRLLNLVGFAFTFGIATLWGVLSYRPDLYASTEPFLVLFFLMYVAIPVLFSRPDAGFGRASPGYHADLRRAADCLWSAGRPGARVCLRIGLERARPGHFLPAAGAHAVVAPRRGTTPAGRGISRPRRGFHDTRHPARLRRALDLGGLGHRGSGDAVGGRAPATAAAAPVRHPAPVPCRCLLPARPADGDGRLAAAQQRLSRCPAAGAGRAVLRLVAAAAAAGTAPGRALAGAAAVCLGRRLVGAGGLREIDRHVRHALQGNAALAFFTASCLAFSALERRLHWPQARYPALALLPLMILLALASSFRDAHPFAHLGYLAWPLAFAAHFFPALPP
jgi:hypothetical protein